MRFRGCGTRFSILLFKTWMRQIVTKLCGSTHGRRCCWFDGWRKSKWERFLWLDCNLLWLALLAASLQLEHWFPKVKWPAKSYGCYLLSGSECLLQTWQNRFAHNRTIGLGNGDIFCFCPGTGNIHFGISEIAQACALLERKEATE